MFATLTNNAGKRSSCAEWSLRSVIHSAQFLNAIVSFAQQIIQMITQRIGRFDWIECMKPQAQKKEKK